MSENPFDELGDMAAFGAESEEEAIALMSEDKEPNVKGPIDIEIGLEECFVRCHPSQFTKASGYLTDSEWFVCSRANDIKSQRADFRTFHAAANYAYRLRDAGVLDTINAVAATYHDENRSTVPEDVMKTMYHAEAHAHECDAAYPAGTWIEMGNGPSILDDDGVTRAYLSQAPTLYTDRDPETKRQRCKDCHEETVHQYPE